MRKEYCGIFGVYGHKLAGRLTHLGLFSLQHRGQESAGIVVDNSGEFHSRRGMGLVSEVFTGKDIEAIVGSNAIGHVRYSTTGHSSTENIQPILVRHKDIPIAMAHNGTISRSKQIRRELEDDGVIFTTGTDSELILKMYAREKGSRKKRLTSVLNRLKGAFSLLILFPGELYAARDSMGFRPLAMGRKNGAVLFSSESCAFDIEAADYERELEPGEIVKVSKNGIESFFLEKADPCQCIFELIYFARPDSYVFGQSVYEARLNMGRQLAIESPVDADIVMPIPDSANVQALGYARQSGIPLEFGLLRNHYIGRTFIAPHQEIRDLAVRIKHTPIRKAVKDKRVIMVDDSIVRGTTSRKLVSMIKKAGAREVHMRISSPPITSSCFYGIDTPTRKELIAGRKNVESIRKFLAVKTLHYLSMEGLKKSCRKEKGEGYCLSCFNGKYPL